jgi:hypothetical protein
MMLIRTQNLRFDHSIIIFYFIGAMSTGGVC